MDYYKQIHPGDVEIETKAATLNALIEYNGITVVDLLIYAQNEANGSMQLSKRVGRSVREVDEYLKNLSAKFENSIKPISLLSNQNLEKKSCFISTGIEKLDQQLSGGIRIGHITEVFGGSGSGKSHFLLQLSLQCQLREISDKNKSIYISTESPLETRRLQDMSENYPEGVSLENVLSIYCQDLENQDHILFTQLPIKLQEDPNIKLVVLDSIAHHLRRDDTISNSSFLLERIKEQELEIKNEKIFNELKKKNRHQLNLFFKSNEKYENRIHKLQYLLLLHRHLLRLANSHNIAIVIANQVSDHATDIKDLSNLHDDGVSLLDLDMQLGFYSGWDKRTTYKYQQMMGITNSIVKSQSISEIESALINSAQPDLRNKRTKVNPDDLDPRFIHKRVNEDEDEDNEDKYNKQKKLVSDLYYLTGGETKKYVPTLSYQWGKHMVSRIMIIKSYKPLLKDRKEIFEGSNTESYLDLPSGSKDTKDEFSSNLQNNPKRPFYDKNAVESILKGWKVQRFIKVIASSVDITGTNNNEKIPFVISKNGLLQI